MGGHRAPPPARAPFPALPAPSWPAPVRRGVAVAAVAAVGVTGGAVALTGLPGATVGPTAARTALVVPAPAPDLGEPDTPDPPVLGPAELGRAVARAQADALRSARRAAAPVEAGSADEDAEEESDEDARTALRARRGGRAADPGPAADCGLDTGGLGAVKPHVRAAARFLGCAFGSPEVLGVAGRGGPSDHPDGLALDFVVDRATGDRLAACAIRNRAALGVSYVIWRQRIDTGSGFRAMEDRGSPTANHFDHVHVSFVPGGGGGRPATC